MDISVVLQDYNAILEDEFRRFFVCDELNHKLIYDAMLYSLMAGGKRVRPVLCMEFCKACGSNFMSSINFAAAIEMIHTYSLIHDDLPAMDNDTLRRNKPTNHVVFGEGIAIQAGDALQTAAFEEVMTADMDYSARVKAGLVLAEAAGRDGMCAGQVLDISYENKELSIDEISNIHEKKTSALLESACKMGVIAAEGNEEQIKAAGEYAKAIGLAFQVRDDILDVISTEEKLGKSVGSDQKNKKNTFVTIFGIEECQNIVEHETQRALKSLKGHFKDTEFLEKFAIWLAKRDH